MKANRFLQDKNAVSPVIGVMLMVVVTVILAAVVSTFASDVGTVEKAPQATIMVTASNTTGLIIEHMGGDPLSCPDIKILTIRTEQAGVFAEVTHEINNSKITHLNDNVTFDTVGTIFQSGDIASVETADSFRPGYTGPNPPVIGEQFEARTIDRISGKPIAADTVIMGP